MISKALLSLAVCGVAAVDSDTTTRLHHHKHVEAHAHKANAAGIIGAAAVGAAGVGALGTMGSFTSDSTAGQPSTSDSTAIDQNICAAGYTGQALACALSSNTASATACKDAVNGATTNVCVWVERSGATAPAINDPLRLTEMKCYANPAVSYTAGTDPCNWYNTNPGMCDGTGGFAGDTANTGVANAADKCVWDYGAILCQQCKSANSACSSFKTQAVCEGALVQANNACKWEPDTTGVGFHCTV